jgi:MtN3 and saliva related transmembrane protein
VSPVWINAVGAGAALCSMASFTPQILKIWPSYGVVLGSWPVAVSNAVCLVASGVILGLKWKFREA